MKLIVKKTSELSVVEIASYCECFKRVFDRIKDPNSFQNEFSNTCIGYSIHSLLMEDDGRIVGSYTGIPMLYKVNGEDMLFAFGVDLMIDAGYRDDVSNLLKVIKANDKAMKEIGVKCFYGFPNDNSYKVNLAFIRMKDVCPLSTYILPYKIGSAKPSLKFLNLFSMLLSYMLTSVSCLKSSSKIVDYKIETKKSEQEKTRYKWFKQTDYNMIKGNRYTCHWKISDFNGVKAAFIMDVYPMSSMNFDKAVRQVFKQSRVKAGLLIYVGILPFTPWTMIKVPHKFAPKNFHFVAKILDKDILTQELVYNPNSWEVNLSSYDLL